MLDTFFEGDGLGFLQRMDGSRWYVFHLITGENASTVHGKDGVEDWLEMTTTDALIDIIREGLQVNVGCIEIWQQVFQRFLTDVARCHEDIPKVCFVRQSGRVYDILQIRQRLRIGVGDARAMVLQAEVNDLLGREVIVAHYRW